MKNSLLIALLFLTAHSLNAQSKSADIPDLEKINLPQLDYYLVDLTFDAKITDNKDPVSESVDFEPHFVGGMANFYTYLQHHILYPRDALKKRIQGKVFIGFIVEKDGSITNIKIMRSVSPDIDAEAARAVSGSPYWLPALINDRPVRAQSVVPITFKLPADSVIRRQLLIDSLGYDPDQKVFTAVEQEPSFVGGINKFYQYLQGIIRYPNLAKRYNVQGKVFITFIVEKDGSLSDIKVVRGIGSGCDEEAVRVLAKSPKWNPGVQNNRPVRVQYTMPIRFTLVSQ